MKVSAIIPAYNEEKTVSNVIRAVKECSYVDDIIVVSDGSTDNTAAVASSMGVRVIELKENLGKGGAMKAGLKSCSSDIILFLDADLVGLSARHVESLLEPVLSCDADMTVGIFQRGRFSTDLAQKISPYLSGQRAVRRDFIESLKDMDMFEYGIEIALTRLARKQNIRVMTVKINDATHIMKEEKLGFYKGFKARMRMYRDIVKSLRN